MITFRKINYEKDIPEIVKLFQKDLDPGYTQNFFKWKHIDNPFGQSYGLLAMDGNNIIGVRMFMYWEFQECDGPKYKAIRPVDTVVSNKYRGRGLFKKLTLQGLEECRNSYDLIFNTPNKNSLPGYLQMGWTQLENTLFFNIGIVNPLQYNKNVKISNTFFQDIEGHVRKEKIKTVQNYDFIKWRYVDRRYFFARHNNSYAIYSSTKVRSVRTIVICELIGNPEDFSLLCNSIAIKNKSVLIYYLNNNTNSTFKFLKIFKRENAIIITKEDIKYISSRLYFSLGDLEGRL